MFLSKLFKILSNPRFSTSLLTEYAQHFKLLLFSCLLDILYCSKLLLFIIFTQYFSTLALQIRERNGWSGGVVVKRWTITKVRSPRFDTRSGQDISETLHVSHPTKGELV